MKARVTSTSAKYIKPRYLSIWFVKYRLRYMRIDLMVGFGNLADDMDYSEMVLELGGQLGDR